MTITPLESRIPQSECAEGDARVCATVEATRNDIGSRGDAAIRDLSVKSDRDDPPSFHLGAPEIETAMRQVGTRDMEDIRFTQTRIRIRRFSKVPRASMTDIAVETLPGVILGPHAISEQSVDCYLPGGKFSMVALAQMSVLTASVAGVPQIIAAVPPVNGAPRLAIDAAMHLGGAHEIHVLGGMQEVGAMALGTRTIRPVDMLVGPGDALVAEAKRQLCDRAGIDLFAEPTEKMIIADDTVDAEMRATDLPDQAEHGYNSPAILVTTSRALAKGILREIDRLLTILPTANTAAISWRDYGAVSLCDSHEDMMNVANGIASEHVLVMTDRDDRYPQNKHSCGALFLGPRPSVANGDKVIGTNHTLPKKGSAETWASYESASC